MNLDHNDFFFDEDVIDTAYKAAQNGNYDIISFMDIECKKYFLPLNKMKDDNINKHHHNLTLVQPELSHYPLFKNEEFDFCDSSIWGKLYKSDIYKQAVNLLGEKRYSTFNINNEDLIGIFVIFKVAKSFKYIRKYVFFI